ncbi:MAG: DUF89 family protein [Planctomycetia bacterium]|nr:MAG: DUF89 family protein [Planctomycetia bacterium]
MLPAPAAPLAQLITRPAYRRCAHPFDGNDAARAYWRDAFLRYTDRLGGLIAAQYPRTTPATLDAFLTALRSAIHLTTRPVDEGGAADLYELVDMEQALLIEWGYPDPYADIKRRENAAALPRLAHVLAELAAIPEMAQLDLLAGGLLAGNRFDLGAEVTAREFFDGRADFFAWRAAQPARPWFRDDLDGWHARWERGAPYRRVLMFVDNAGADVVLGCLPLVGWMLRRGSRVTLAANSRPALNDVTAAELVELLAQAADFDDSIARGMGEGQLDVLETGSGTSLIDLSRLLPAFVAESSDADLVMLHGMGRALESNSAAQFQCDAVWTATIKDALVAAQFGASLYDCVFRFEPIERG